MSDIMKNLNVNSADSNAQILDAHWKYWPKKAKNTNSNANIDRYNACSVKKKFQ